MARQREELENLGTPFFPLDVLFEYGFILGEAELKFLQELILRLEEMEENQENEMTTPTHNQEE